MAQIIKHRRGSLEGLAAVTSSINKGELVIATGSSNLSVSNGSSIVFAATADGQLQAVNRILLGTASPSTFTNATYNGLVNGVPFYDSTSGSLWILGTNSNTKLNLIGNINSFSQSVDSRLGTVEASLGGGGSIGTRVSALEVSSASLNLFSASQLEKDSTLQTYTASVNTRLTEIGVVSGSLILSASSFESRLGTIGSYTSSLESRMSSLATISGSLILTASSNVQRLTELESYSASLKTAIGVSGQNVTIKGDLTVQGVTTQVDSTTINLADNVLQLNAAGTSDGGLVVRDATGGSTTSGSLLWDVTNDYWKAGKLGSESPILLAGGSGVVSGSSQINVYQTTNFSSFDTALSTITGSLISSASDHESRIDSIETSLGGGGSIGTRVSGLEAKTGSYATTGSNTFVSSQTISGDIFLSGSSRKIYNNNGSTNLIFGQYDGSSIYGPYYQLFGNNYAAADQRGTAEFVFDTRNGGGGFLVAGYDGNTWNRYFRVDRTGNTQVTGSLFVSGAISGSTLTGVGNVTAYSASVNSRLSLLEISSGALNTFSSSQLTQNSTLATYTGSVETRLTQIGVVSGSLISSASAAAISISNLNSFSSSTNSRLTTLEGTGTIQGLGTGNNVTFAKVTTTGDVVVGGDLVVQGNTVTLNTATVIVEDKLITLASGSTSSATADGAGFEIAGTSAQFVYQHSTTAFTSSVAVIAPEVTASLNVPGYGSSKRMAFRAATGNLDFVAAPSNTGDLVQWNGTDFVMSNVIDGGQY
jgi:hypothetical protein